MDRTPRTRAVTAGRPSAAGQPMNTPIVPASSFVAGGAHTYAREDGTPTWEALETAIGELEGGQATAFASGLAAVSAVLDLCEAGAEVVVPTFSYVGTREQLGHAARMGRLKVRQIAPDDTTAWAQAARDADLLWIESPTNPTLDLIDIAPLTRQRARVVVDNTFATPLGATPLADGADIVVHSATKMIGGHSDLLLGLTVTADETLARELRSTRTRTGGTPGVLEAWLALRGLRTLPVRLAEQSRTAALLAERLTVHPAVTRVRHAGTMVAFELPDAEAADRLCERLDLVVHATSLGGVESNIERRATWPGDAHVPAGLVRFSVGLEDPEDLWRDLAQALG